MMMQSGRLGVCTQSLVVLVAAPLLSAGMRAPPNLRSTILFIIPPFNGILRLTKLALECRNLIQGRSTAGYCPKLTHLSPSLPPSGLFVSPPLSSFGFCEEISFEMSVNLWSSGYFERFQGFISICKMLFLWLRLTCVFQAILFYIPRWLWKNWEAGKVSALRMDLNLGIISDVEKKLKKKLLIDYLYSNLKHHNFWAYRYFFCEFLALLNVSGRISDTRRLVPGRKGLARLHFSCSHLVPETLSWAVELCKRWPGGKE